MKRVLLLSPIMALCVSCTTLDQSFRLGAATGALTGAAATYAAGNTSGRQPTLEEVGIGASIAIARGNREIEFRFRQYTQSAQIDKTIVKSKLNWPGQLILKVSSAN